MTSDPQRILVFQQNSQGSPKIEGIRRYGGDDFSISVGSIDSGLPEVLDDTDGFLPEQGQPTSEPKSRLPMSKGVADIPSEPRCLKKQTIAL